MVSATGPSAAVAGGDDGGAALTDSPGEGVADGDADDGGVNVPPGAEADGTSDGEAIGVEQAEMTTSTARRIEARPEWRIS